MSFGHYKKLEIYSWKDTSIIFFIKLKIMVGLLKAHNYKPLSNIYFLPK